MEQLEFLSRVGLFNGLNSEELKKILPLCRKDGVGPGELIFEEGAVAEDVCVVIEGRAELRFEMPGKAATGEQTLSIVQPTKSFGWSTLVPPHQITLSVYGGEDGCTFFRLKGQSLVRLFEEDYRIGYYVMRNLTRVIAKRFHRMENEVARHEGMNLMHKW